MRSKKEIKKFKFLIEDWLALKRNPLMMFLILTLLPVIYIIVYSTGGIKFVYSHSMYIPIILAGIFYGASFGAFIAFAAAILLGPLMPIDTQTGELQETINWLYRMLIFVVVGTIIGYASSKLRKDAHKIEDLMSVNQETGVPNTNFLKKMCHLIDAPSYTTITALFNNHHSIIDILGVDVFHLLINQIYVDLEHKLPTGSYIIQSDSNKLWIIIPNESIDEHLKIVMDIFNEPRQIKKIPLYVDYSLGASILYDLKGCQNFTIFEDSDISARVAQINNLIYVIGDKDKYKKRTEYDLLATLSQSMESGETYLVFQPKVDLKTQIPYGLEALARWNHPTRGFIPPDVFIPLVEETKLIHMFTDWVLKKALEKSIDLQKQGFNIPISINISAKNFYDPQFYDRCVKMIKESKVAFDLLEFELTESTLMVNPLESKEILDKFARLGIRISIDDFGSGYSSLAYLTQFPLNYIKIDRLFMKNIENDSSMLSIVKSTVELSKSLGYQVVIEGVETKEVVDILVSMGCDFAQGYYFAKPMSSSDVNQYFSKHLNKQ
jgi:EAL domain-containing protein (putative c-di-GMP-specific phosphodiesterase class I)